MLQPGPQREAHASSHPSNDTTTKETMGRCQNNLSLLHNATSLKREFYWEFLIDVWFVSVNAQAFGKEPLAC